MSFDIGALVGQTFYVCSEGRVFHAARGHEMCDTWDMLARIFRLRHQRSSRRSRGSLRLLLPSYKKRGLPHNSTIRRCVYL
ncbi:hypothetical protein GQ600_13819 [Phytophthora cactorum]|nr:hypothetical protein GQ600_13819 [Phytophthora cactorum]